MIDRFAPWPVLLFVLAVTAVLMGLAQAQLVAPSGSADTGFSQQRAFATLSRLLKEERPHIVGSPENMIVRDRILEELRAYGYTPEIQSAFQCGTPDRFPGCTQVENIIAVHKGTAGGKAVLVTAHYDSVGAGPGVSDDGAGTAIVLELARSYVGRQTKNDLIFLITDGEETGLRGAFAFAERHALMKQVAIVLNLEARGASGPSMMFETGPGSANLMSLFAQAVPRPTANSLTYEIYKLLPNDTDFSVYRAKGLSGFNFAYSNSASLYHSERDNLANIDRNSLQHHGDNAFALTAVLADTDLAALRATSDASYFDVFGQVLIVWPAAINLPVALLAFFAMVGLIAVHRGAFSLRAAASALGALIAVPLLLFAAGWLLSYPLGVWPGVHPIDHPEPWPGRVALAAAAAAIALSVAVVVRRIDVRALLLVNWLVLAALGVALAWYVTGASFLLIWPALGLAAAAWIETLTRKAQSLHASALVGFVLVAFFWLQYLLALELVLGFNLSHFKILVLVPFVLALVPVFAEALAGPASRALPAVALGAAVTVVAAIVASQTPAYALNHPRGLDIVYYDDRSTTPRWFTTWVGPPDEAYLKRTGFPAMDEAYMLYGLFEEKGRFKPATDLKLEAPSLVIDELATAGDLTVARGALRGGRGGLQLALGVAPGSGIRSIRFAGQEVVDAARLGRDEPTTARVTGWGARDIPVEIAFDANASPAVYVIERSPLPESEEAAALLAARPPEAAPVHAGNVAIVVVKRDLRASVPAAIPSPPPPTR